MKISPEYPVIRCNQNYMYGIAQFLNVRTIPQNREKIVEIIIKEDISIDQHDF